MNVATFTGAVAGVGAWALTRGKLGNALGGILGVVAFFYVGTSLLGRFIGNEDD